MYLSLIFFQEASLYEATQEITYLDNVVQESLRLYPPAPRYAFLSCQHLFINLTTSPVAE